MKIKNIVIDIHLELDALENIPVSLANLSFRFSRHFLLLASSFQNFLIFQNTLKVDCTILSFIVAI